MNSSVTSLTNAYDLLQNELIRSQFRTPCENSSVLMSLIIMSISLCSTQTGWAWTRERELTGVMFLQLYHWSLIEVHLFVLPNTVRSLEIFNNYQIPPAFFFDQQYIFNLHALTFNVCLLYTYIHHFLLVVMSLFWMFFWLFEHSLWIRLSLLHVSFFLQYNQKGMDKGWYL